MIYHICECGEDLEIDQHLTAPHISKRESFAVAIKFKPCENCKSKNLLATADNIIELNKMYEDKLQKGIEEEQTKRQYLRDQFDKFAEENDHVVCDNCSMAEDAKNAEFNAEDNEHYCQDCYRKFCKDEVDIDEKRSEDLEGES